MTTKKKKEPEAEEGGGFGGLFLPFYLTLILSGKKLEGIFSFLFPAARWKS